MYKFRDLPCSITDEDKLWCVSGSYHDNDESYMHGILEYCYSPEDAFNQYIRMMQSDEHWKHFNSLKIEPFIKVDCSYVNTGNTVLCIFDHRLFSTTKPAERGEAIKRVKITKITERYGSYGDYKVNPLIEGIDIETNEKESFDSAFIVQVIDKKYMPTKPYNIFSSRRIRPSICRSGNKFHTTFGEALRYVLGALPYKLTRHINDDAYLLWASAGKPGLKKETYRGIYVINEKPFRSWVKRNHTRLMITKAEQDERETESIKEYEKDFMEEVLSDWI